MNKAFYSTILCTKYIFSCFIYIIFYYSVAHNNCHIICSASICINHRIPYLCIKIDEPSHFTSIWTTKVYSCLWMFFIMVKPSWTAGLLDICLCFFILHPHKNSTVFSTICEYLCILWYHFIIKFWYKLTHNKLSRFRKQSINIIICITHVSISSVAKILIIKLLL